MACSLICHCGRDKMPAILQTTFSNSLFDMNLLYFDPSVFLQCNNNPMLVQVMAWCRTGNRPLSEPSMVYCIDAYIYNRLLGPHALLRLYKCTIPIQGLSITNKYSLYVTVKGQGVLIPTLSIYSLIKWLCWDNLTKNDIRIYGSTLDHACILVFISFRPSEAYMRQ